MQKLKAFLLANKVIIFGLIAAGAMTYQQLSSQFPTDYKVLIFAAIVAALGFLSKNLRGQWASILGSLLPSLGVVLDQMETHTHISTGALIGGIALALSGVFAPPAKSLSYEKTPEIVAAKKDAADIDASAQPPKNPPVSTK